MTPEAACTMRSGIDDLTVDNLQWWVQVSQKQVHMHLEIWQNNPPCHPDVVSHPSLPELLFFLLLYFCCIDSTWADPPD